MAQVKGIEKSIAAKKREVRRCKVFVRWFLGPCLQPKVFCKLRMVSRVVLDQVVDTLLEHVTKVKLVS